MCHGGPTLDRPPEPASMPTAPTAAARARVALAAALLLGSLALRQVQAARVDARLRDGRTPPFALAELPMALGHWSGVDEAMEPRIARATGCTDHVFRTYVDGRTGARVGVIVLYGPATEVFIHAPEQCYPAQGYALAEGPEAREVGGRAYRSLVFEPGARGVGARQEVCYSWRLGGTWSPDLPRMKRLERAPGMYKVHLARRVAPGEYRRAGNPSEDLLAALGPELDRRIDAARR